MLQLPIPSFQNCGVWFLNFSETLYQLLLIIQIKKDNFKGEYNKPQHLNVLCLW